MSDASYRRHRNQVSLEHTARSISARIPPELMTSVEALAPRVGKPRIPAEHLQALEELKLAERRFGLARLTPLGRCLLML